MSMIQESITSILHERNNRKHLALVVSMIAVATALAVIWALHINGITLASGDLVCGMEEHTHTSDCYAWVPVEDGTEETSELKETEEGIEPEEAETASEVEEMQIASDTELSANTENDIETEDGTVAAGEVDGNSSETANETASGIQTESALSGMGTESVGNGTESVENGTESVTEDGTEALTEEETESPQLGDTKIVNGVEYVYSLICGMEEHTHTEECYASDDTEETEAEELTAASVSLTAGVASVGAARLGSAGTTPSAGVSAVAEEDDGNSSIATVSEEEGNGTTLLTSTNTSSDDPADYNLAYTVDGSPSSGNYIIYTYDSSSDTYYVLNTDGTLTACTKISSVTEATESGPYYVESTGTIVYGTTSEGSTAYTSAQWTVTQDTSAKNTYTISNSANYLAPTGTGDNATIDTKFSANTANVTLSGDFTLTYTFYNVSKGTDNWDNFIVEIYNTNGVYVDVRADNYGWLANQDSSDTLTFGDGSADWDTWAAAMQGGQEATVTITRTGQTIVVTTTAAGETFTATAYVSEYTDGCDLTIHLTGEECELSNISYTCQQLILVSSASTVSCGAAGVTITGKAPSSSAVADFTPGISWSTITTASVFYFAEVQESADSYHFADTVTLADAANEQGESYVVYTKIGSTYYIVSAVDGSLLECTDISDDSYSENEKLLLSAGAGVYIWDYDDEGKPVFKFTTGEADDGEDEFEDYWWTLSSDDASGDGSGEYSFYNENEAEYLAPSLNTATETITDGNSQSADTQPSIDSYGTFVYTVTVDSSVSSSSQIQLNIVRSGYLSAAVSRVQIRIMSTGISLTTQSTYTNYYPLGDMTISNGDVLTVSVTTFAGGLYFNCYNETQGTSSAVYVETTLDFSSGAYMYVYVYRTAVTVSAVTAGYSGTTSYGVATGLSSSSYSLTTKEKVGSGVIDWPAFPASTANSKDFDVTYSFSNITTGEAGSVATLADSFSLYLGNASSGETASIEVSFAELLSSGSSDTSWAYTTASSGTYSDDNVLEALKDTSGADCTVRVIRTGNHFFFILSVTSNGVTYTKYASTTADGFDGCDAYMYLAGQYCTISNISYYDNTTRSYNENDYVRLSKIKETLSVSATGNVYEWTANGYGYYSEEFALIAQLAPDTANTAEIDWVTDAAAEADATGTATTTLSNASVSKLADADNLITTFSLARVREYTVHFDPTNGGTLQYQYAAVQYYANTSATETTTASSGSYAMKTYSDALGNNYYIILPTATIGGYYPYTLAGWYDIYNEKYYITPTANTSIEVTGNTVFYADWEIGEDQYVDGTETGAFDGLDTSGFVTTKVFDYNDDYDKIALN